MITSRHERMRVEDTALIVVDMQERLMAVMPDPAGLTDRARRMIEGARHLGLPVVFTEQAPAKLGPTVEPLRALMGEPAIEKVSFSCWDCPTFQDRLSEIGRRELILVGIETHVCVWQTARDLLAAGHRVEVVADAVASRDTANRELALARLRDAGAGITCVEMALFELLRTAGHDAFRAISRLVR